MTTETKISDIVFTESEREAIAREAAWKELKRYLFIQDAELETRRISQENMRHLLNRAIAEYQKEALKRNAVVIEAIEEGSMPLVYIETADSRRNERLENLAKEIMDFMYQQQKEPTQEDFVRVAGAIHAEVVKSYNATAKPYDSDWQEKLYERLAQAAIASYHKGTQPVKDWHDRDDYLTPEIDKYHPLKTGDHATRQKANELVGNRHSKGALIDLVNYLLKQAQPAETSELVEIIDRVKEFFDKINIGASHGELPHGLKTKEAENEWKYIVRKASELHAELSKANIVQALTALAKIEAQPAETSELVKEVANLAMTHTWCFAKEDEAQEFARKIIALQAPKPETSELVRDIDSIKNSCAQARHLMDFNKLDSSIFAIIEALLIKCETALQAPKQEGLVEYCKDVEPLVRELTKGKPDKHYEILYSTQEMLIMELYDKLKSALSTASIQPSKPDELVEKILNGIILDFTDRRGLRQEWENIDGATKIEIKEAWRDIIKQALNNKQGE